MCRSFYSKLVRLKVKVTLIRQPAPNGIVGNNVITKVNASDLATQTYFFIKLNIEVDSGKIKERIGDEKINYVSIAKRLNASPSGIKRAVDFLNEHELIQTHVVEMLVGDVVVVKHFKNNNKE